ncbi:uncharacterized protein LOC117317427 [Pecten maximus]|uniref:uncharacterized protein LOC117317427 n=1 Tax=Pecten maximus TaxID=6579 RepID=UPI001458BAA0|nr:uncharacterized protein LOC117317427 [Pecten maximus]
MPCRGSSNADYQETLDELTEIIAKYNVTANIIIGDDKNASLMRNSPQDKLFQTFITENNLRIPQINNTSPTFYHHNGRDTSQIDYFAESGNLISSYTIFEREACNTSTDDPILVTEPCVLKLPKEDTHNANKHPKSRVLWSKVDKMAYQQESEKRLSELIDDSENLTNENLSGFIEKLINILSTSADNQGGKRKAKKATVGKRTWPPKLAEAAKQSKIHHARWKAAGKPAARDNIHYQNKLQSIKKLRSLQRQLEAANRTDRYKQLMDLDERNRTEFYQLIKQQRNPANIATSTLLYKTKLYNDDNSICNAWADYFEELSTPISHSDFDSDHEDLVTNDIETLTTMFENHNVKNLPTITLEEVSNTIMSFKNGKSPDQEGISAEHLKYRGPTLTSILTIIINYIFKNLYIPDFLKAGIATPVLKKGKQNTDPNSYRKITVTNLIGKVIEKIHLQHNNSLILKQQSKLQKGFTKNEMPTAAALILTELITEANKTRSPLYVALMDAKKAFDILWHAGLLREMYKFGLTGDNWTFLRTGMKT